MQEIQLKELIMQQIILRGSFGEFLLKATATIYMWSSD